MIVDTQENKVRVLMVICNWIDEECGTSIQLILVIGDRLIIRIDLPYYHGAHVLYDWDLETETERLANKS